MNVDGDDVAVPIASPTGKTPSEVMTQGRKNEKLYYFSPFDMYSENTQTKEVQALNPKYALERRNDTQAHKSADEINIFQEKEQKLKEKFQQAKIEAKAFKKSEKFQELKQGIKDQILNIPKEEFSFNMLDMSYAANYTSPGSSNVFVPWPGYSSGCWGKTPCYKQFYSWNCISWCAPTAMWIIFGYHDRNWYYGLVNWTAPSILNNNVKSMISNIKYYMQTDCYGSTNDSKIKLWIQYAKNRWYSNASSSFNSSLSPWGVYNLSKIEVNASRPLIVSMWNYNNGDGHAAVIFWYKSYWSSPIVRMNMGWGQNHQEGWYYTSNLDQNLNSIFYDNSYSHIPYSTTTIRIN